MRQIICADDRDNQTVLGNIKRIYAVVYNNSSSSLITCGYKVAAIDILPLQGYGLLSGT